MADAGFNPLISPDAMRKLVADTEASTFEATAVRTALKLLGLSAAEKTLKRVAKEKYGTYSLPFDLFRAAYPEMPLQLYASTLRGIKLSDGRTTPNNYRVHMDQEATEPARYFNYTKVVFVQAFLELLRSLPRGTVAGLVYPRAGVRTGMLIHNDATAKGWTRGGCFVYKTANSMVFQQPFANYLSMLKESGWAPVDKIGDENDGE